MDYENLKKAVQEIKMPAEMQTRITERCRAAAAQQSPPASQSPIPAPPTPWRT